MGAQEKESKQKDGEGSEHAKEIKYLSKLFSNSWCFFCWILNSSAKEEEDEGRGRDVQERHNSY